MGCGRMEGRDGASVLRLWATMVEPNRGQKQSRELQPGDALIPSPHFPHSLEPCILTRTIPTQPIGPLHKGRRKAGSRAGRMLLGTAWHCHRHAPPGLHHLLLLTTTVFAVCLVWFAAASRASRSSTSACRALSARACRSSLARRTSAGDSLWRTEGETAPHSGRGTEPETARMAYGGCRAKGEMPSTEVRLGGGALGGEGRKVGHTHAVLWRA